jgi:pyridoxal/pyridoxine/pyridoxamine kinase
VYVVYGQFGLKIAACMLMMVILEQWKVAAVLLGEVAAVLLGEE